MPRKTQNERHLVGALALASMRPRPDAAENGLDPAPPAAAALASMRPRPDAAENDAARLRHRRPALASMRPRPDAAENARVRSIAARARPASMRPRPDAAENTAGAARPPGRRRGFNEAAARCRGKPGACSTRRRAATGRFNEAAARCRGKPGRRGRNAAGDPGASMRPRPDAAENKDVTGMSFAFSVASMRPRPDAAENIRGHALPAACRDALQ